MGRRIGIRRLLRHLYPEGNLGEQTLFSSVWVFATQFINRGLTLLMFVVLGRLLGPAPIGVYGIAIVLIVAMQSFTDHGINAALIQRREEDVNEALHTLFSVEIVRGLFIGSVLYLGAPLLASFFAVPAVVDVLRVMALAPVIFAFKNPGILYFQKALEFHRKFVYQVASTVIQFVVAVVLGFYWRSIWALVAAYLALNLAQTVLSYVVHEFRPRPTLDVSLLRTLLGYGKWITASSYLYFFFDRGDDLVVGWLLASTALGYYQMAYRMANAPASEISGTLSGVLFPTFSRLQDDEAALREAFYKSFQLTLFVAFPMTFGIVAVAPAFVRAFLGAAWIPMTTTLQLLAVFGLQMAIGPPIGSLWKAVGRPDFSTKLMLVRVLLMAILLVPATRAFGIEGTATTILLIGVVAILPLDAYLVVEHTVETSYRRFFSEIAYPLAAGSLMFGVILAVRETVAFPGPAVELVVLVAAGVLAYALAVGLLVWLLHWDISRNVRWMLTLAARRT